MERCLSSYTIDELKRHGIATDQAVRLEFLSGITVAGHLQQILRREQKNIVMSFSDCTVTTLDGQRLFEPAWGVFDMLVGAEIVSVFGGSADPIRYPLYAEPSSEHAGDEHQSAELDGLYEHYAAIRRCRDASGSAANADELAANALKRYPNEWLLLFEAAELQPACHPALLERLQALAEGGNDERKRLINYGLARLATKQERTRHTA
ncbi:MAG: hypothetical protein AAGC71_18370 [Pseudomonadota bacterium]